MYVVCPIWSEFQRHSSRWRKRRNENEETPPTLHSTGHIRSPVVVTVFPFFSQAEFTTSANSSLAVVAESKDRYKKPNETRSASNSTAMILILRSLQAPKVLFRYEYVHVRCHRWRGLPVTGYRQLGVDIQPVFWLGHVPNGVCWLVNIFWGKFFLLILV